MDQQLEKVSSHLDEADANFVYNLEVLGMPVKAAAKLAGVSVGRALQPIVVEARQRLKEELRGVTAITKEDVVYGIREAIDRARIFAEPMTEIVGWEKLAKLLGFNEPEKVDINLKASIEVVQKNMKTIPTPDLVKLLGAGNVIDVEFYDVGRS
jgi:hypothetical protein